MLKYGHKDFTKGENDAKNFHHLAILVLYRDLCIT